ncbi:MAG: hypothetical protein ACN6O8_16650 [Achromobacter sp.]
MLTLRARRPLSRPGAARFPMAGFIQVPAVTLARALYVLYSNAQTSTP